jgi:hypothetical protein
MVRNHELVDYLLITSTTVITIFTLCTSTHIANFYYITGGYSFGEWARYDEVSAQS